MKSFPVLDGHDWSTLPVGRIELTEEVADRIASATAEDVDIRVTPVLKRVGDGHYEIISFLLLKKNWQYLRKIQSDSENYSGQILETITRVDLTQAYFD